MRLFITALFIAMWFSADCRCEDKPASEKEYKDALSKLGLVPIVHIKEAHYYGDGGTNGFELSGWENTRFSFCLDGRMNVFDDDKDENADHRVYISATHPEHKNAKLVARGGKEERALLIVLKVWLASEYRLKDEGQHVGGIKRVVAEIEKHLKAVDTPKK
jgi:hypothetical protein